MTYVKLCNWNAQLSNFWLLCALYNTIFQIDIIIIMKIIMITPAFIIFYNYCDYPSSNFIESITLPFYIERVAFECCIKKILLRIP